MHILVGGFPNRDGGGGQVVQGKASLHLREFLFQIAFLD